MRVAEFQSELKMWKLLWASSIEKLKCLRFLITNPRNETQFLMKALCYFKSFHTVTWYNDYIKVNLTGFYMIMRDKYWKMLSNLTTVKFDRWFYMHDVVLLFHSVKLNLWHDERTKSKSIFRMRNWLHFWKCAKNCRTENSCVSCLLLTNNIKQSWAFPNMLSYDENLSIYCLSILWIHSTKLK